MKRTLKTLSILIFVLAMILTSCGGNSDSNDAKPDPGTAPEDTTLETTADALPVLTEPNVVAFCDLGICANFPVLSTKDTVNSDDVNADAVFTDHHVLGSSVPFSEGDNGPAYCDGVAEGCPETETYTIQVLPVNEVNTAATSKPGKGELGEDCTFGDTTVTGTKAHLERCSYDGIPVIARLIVPTEKYIYVASGTTTTSAYDLGDSLQRFFDGVGLKTP